jgi:hypothetical protein
MSHKPKKPQHDLLSAGGGSWVALSSSGVIGKGLTAQDAVTAAKISRVKESVQVIYLPTDQTPPLEMPAMFDRVRAAVNDPSRVWLVGGAVRDTISISPLKAIAWRLPVGSPTRSAARFLFLMSRAASVVW